MHPLYDAMKAAEAAHEAALVAAYGANAVTARYSPLMNRVTPELHASYEAMRAASDAYFDQFRMKGNAA